MKFNRLGIMLASAMMMVGISTLAASAAQAFEGPLWIVGAGGTSLASGQTRAIRSKNISKTFRLVGAINIVCNKVESAGFLLGGHPGTDYSEIKFKECFREGHEKCTATGVRPLKAANKGEIIVDTLTVLTYGDPETKSALDAFAAEGEPGSPNLFVVFKLEGGTTECGVFNNVEVKVEAIGTEIEIKSEKRKCGQLAQVGEINATKEFRLSKSGETAEKGALNFPEKLTSAYLPEGSVLRLIKCELEADTAPAEELGLAEVKTEPAEPFGWDT
jgi:hypothetical protein